MGSNTKMSFPSRSCSDFDVDLHRSSVHQLRVFAVSSLWSYQCRAILMQLCFKLLNVISETTETVDFLARLPSDSVHFLGARLRPNQWHQHVNLCTRLWLFLGVRLLAVQIDEPGVVSASTNLILWHESRLKPFTAQRQQNVTCQSKQFDQIRLHKFYSFFRIKIRSNKWIQIYS